MLVSSTMNHTNTSQHRRKGKDLYPCTQTNMCGQVYLSGFYFGGASLGSVPRPQRVVCAKTKRKTHILSTCPPALCLWHTQCSIIRVMLGCEKILTNQTISLSMQLPFENIKIASTITHHSTFQFQIHKYQSTTVGHKLPERRLSLSTNQRFGGYAHVGDAVPHTHSNTSIFSSITLQLKQQ